MSEITRAGRGGQKDPMWCAGRKITTSVQTPRQHWQWIFTCSTFWAFIRVMAEGIKGFFGITVCFLCCHMTSPTSGHDYKLDVNHMIRLVCVLDLHLPKKGKGHSDLQFRFNLLRLLPVTATVDSALNLSVLLKLFTVSLKYFLRNIYFTTFQARTIMLLSLQPKVSITDLKHHLASTSADTYQMHPDVTSWRWNATNGSSVIISKCDEHLTCNICSDFLYFYCSTFTEYICWKVAVLWVKYFNTLYTAAWGQTRLCRSSSRGKLF